MSYRIKNIITLVLFVLTAWVVVPWQGKPFQEKISQYFTLKQGLDLQGGTEIRLEIQDKAGIDNLREATEQAKDILIQRINRFGLTQPRIQTQEGGRILVQIPGAGKDIDRINKILTTTGRLEFRIEAPQVTKDKVQAGQTTAPEGYVWKEMRDGSRILLNEDVPLTGKYINKSSASRNPGGTGYMVTLDFTQKGGEKFAQVTRENVGKRMAIVLDGVVQSAPVLQEAITGGTARITGDFAYEEAQQIATILKSGKLSAPLTKISQRTVGPGLGDDSIQRGKYAIGLAIVLVLVFMLLYYRGLGVVANITLLLNLLLLFAIVMKLGATMTLAGIAGVVLTVGMAVDASVIIFERIREELDRVDSPRAAFESGWEHAFWAVFDANITTLIIAIILYLFGTGPIKGFATILIIGILTTLFTVFFSERAMIEGLMRMGMFKKFRMFRFFSGTSIPFLKKFPATFVISIICIAGAIGSFGYGAASGGRIFSIDFMGGQLFTVRFSEPAQTDFVRNTFQSFQPEGADFTPYSGAEIQRIRLTEEEKNEAEKPSLFQIRLKGERFDQLRDLRVKQDFQQALAKFDPVVSTLSDYEVRVKLKNVRDHGLVQQHLREFAYSISRIQPYNNVDVERAFSSDQEGESSRSSFTVTLKEGLFQKYFRHDVFRMFPDHVYPEPFQSYSSSNRTLFQLVLQNELSVDEAKSTIRKAFAGVEDKLDLSLTKGLLVEPKPLDYGNPSTAKESKGNQDSSSLKSSRLFELTLHPSVSGKLQQQQDEILTQLRQSSDLQLTKEPFQQISSIGSSVADQLKQGAAISMVVALLAIIIYLMIRFRFSYGLAAVIAVIHDVIITVGVVALVDLMLPPSLGINLDIGLASLAAFLTVIGYSVNDTIVTFDRIREIIRSERRSTFGDIIDRSINLNLSRTILTSVTTFMAALVLFWMTAQSGSDVASFAFPILVGVVVGTYSSMFVASPALVHLPYVGKSKDTRASRL